MARQIGLSLCFCVLDILTGHVNEDDVLVIICPEGITEEFHFWNMVRDYKERHWSDNPEAAAEIALRLRRAGKLVPVSETKKRLSCVVFDSTWANPECYI